MKAILFGTGWRSLFYIHIAKALPSLLTIEAVVTRNPDRIKEMEKEGLYCTTDTSKALSLPHDISIVSSGPNGYYPLMRTLKERNEFVLSETSFLPLNDEELSSLEGMKGATAEQYMFTPLYGSIIEAVKQIGHIDQLYVSGLHNHHAASIARTILSPKNETPIEVQSLDWASAMPKTGSRAGLCITGEEEQYTRKIRLLRFDDNKLFINDFSSNQYHSELYGKVLEARGSRGIVTEKGIRTLDEHNYPIDSPFIFHRETQSGSMTLSHVSMGGRTVFINPFYPAPFNDDEIGIATIIKAIDEGKAYPTIDDGIRDARLGRYL